jgi:hypothetical protein
MDVSRKVNNAKAVSGTSGGSQFSVIETVLLCVAALTRKVTSSRRNKAKD